MLFWTGLFFKMSTFKSRASIQEYFFRSAIHPFNFTSEFRGSFLPVELPVSLQTVTDELPFFLSFLTPMRIPLTPRADTTAGCAISWKHQIKHPATVTSTPLPFLSYFFAFPSWISAKSGSSKLSSRSCSSEAVRKTHHPKQYQRCCIIGYPRSTCQ